MRQCNPALPLLNTICLSTIIKRNNDIYQLFADRMAASPRLFYHKHINNFMG